MKPFVLPLLGLLLTGSVGAQQHGHDPKLAVTVTTKTGKTVEVKGPEVALEPDPDFSWGWERPSVLPNRSGSFIAVHYYRNIHTKYWDANVFLVRPDGRTEQLKNDTVLNIQWSEDGRYLIGTGDNTIRLWNLNGGARQVTFPDIRASRVTGKTLCLNVNWYSPTTGQLSRTAELHLALPSLTQVSDKDTDGDVTCGARP
ncbi:MULTISPECIES: hypothetical protein [Deinococcus]|uniref:WD40 repeat domain-containing protein n=1 Tax=Deinococcus rufus TaxID=2136097 RepID=A0ABV7ZDZ2_9DEIO|nr:hypothetical protein [Deinococcus sp. AB2017081]WQE94246.1 hypothetical protein U2P90_12595 [Deinococcus sp. AB2017081]